MKSSKEEKEQWVIKYLRDIDAHVNIYNAKFVDSYIDRFNAKHKIMMWGANKCPELGRLLSNMYSQGILDRGRISLSGTLVHDGYAKWVYVYSLRGYFKNKYKNEVTK